MKTFKEFILESEKSLKKISSAWERRYPGMKLNLSHSEMSNSIRLDKIEVPKDKRGKGIGSRVMKGLKKYADRTNRNISLTPEPEKGYKTKLDNFYKQHGFKPNKGKNKDYSTSDSMIRRPNE